MERIGVTETPSWRDRQSNRSTERVVVPSPDRSDGRPQSTAGNCDVPGEVLLSQCTLLLTFIRASRLDTVSCLRWNGESDLLNMAFCAIQVYHYHETVTDSLDEV